MYQIVQNDTTIGRDDVPVDENGDGCLFLTLHSISVAVRETTQILFLLVQNYSFNKVTGVIFATWWAEVLN